MAPRTSAEKPLETAYVLHRRPYRDSSLIAELLTEDNGRIVVVARGAKRPKSGVAAVNQLFQPIAAAWSGKGEMGTLTRAEPLGPPRLLQGQVLFSGLYVNELLVRLLPRHAPCPEIFMLYSEVMSGLSAAGSDDSAIQRELRRFELCLLQNMGYGLDLEHVADGGSRIDETASYLYRHDLGLTSFDGSVGAEQGVVVSGRTLIAMRTGTLQESREFSEAKRLMRFVLSVYIGPRPLNSRQVFRAFSHHGKRAQ
ncbi:MAG: DNA repair protein RecO [Gammaproteobacteria bacterium]|nr:DNA repair protein RecO [Gammaproteobacteria bacterium]